jgi:glycosyltransferase involved in cell wall biosynthesis
MVNTIFMVIGSGVKLKGNKSEGRYKGILPGRNLYRWRLITIFVVMAQPTFSIVVPVYNRPHEVAELLESLTKQTIQDFEVVLIEDGSSITCESVFEQYSSRLSIQYFFKPNSGPGPSRNFGFERAKGRYFVVFDSDCILPPHYFESVEIYLRNEKADAWGGPDRGMKNFTTLQQAMAFTMSSLLTTGGIRGGKQKAFQPRSFNMGFSREVFEKTGGFHFDRYAEDIELSIRIRKLGFKTALIQDAFVYHKRRTTLSQFYRQVSNFGKGRILVGRKHPGEVKLTHWLPVFFLLGVLAIPLLAILVFPLGVLIFFIYLVYVLMVAVDCFIVTLSFKVALLSVPSLFVQMFGYGTGFLKALFK